MPFVALAKKGRTRLALPNGKLGAIAAVHTMEPIEPPWLAIKEWIPTLRSGHADCKILLRISFFMMRRLAAAGTFPTTNPPSTGSTVPGIPMSLTQTGSTKVPHGKHPKSIWTTAERWFSNTPDKQEAHPPQSRRQKESWQSGPESYARGK
jgi:hypothetical protein